MERINLVNTNNGMVLRLPPGFRFHPTDEELVMQYLRRKVLAVPIPALIIPDADVNRIDPWDLPGDTEQERYFFSMKEVKYPNGNRVNRSTISGYWKATGLDKPVAAARTHQVVGMKKTLVFYHGKAPRGGRTNWIMHEYRLNIPYPYNMPPDRNWVVCRIFLKKRGAREEDDPGEVVEDNGEASSSGTRNVPVFYDFLTKTRFARGRKPANSNCSGVTNDDGEDEDTEEDSGDSGM